MYNKIQSAYEPVIWYSVWNFTRDSFINKSELISPG